MATTNFVPGTVVASTWLNDVDAAIYQTSSEIVSAIDRTLADKNSDYVSILDYGAVGDGTTDDLAAIQLALDSNAGLRAVYAPTAPVHYSLSGTLRIPSYTTFYGDGAATIIKMADNVVRDKSLVVTGFLDDHRSYIKIANMTLDYNETRHANANGTGMGSGAGNVLGSGDAVDQSCLVICNSSYVYIDNVRALDGYKHCIDVCAPSYVDTDPGVAVNVYDPEPSFNVFINNCYAVGAGDDNVTTHHSYNIWINNTLSRNPSGVRTNDNTNCFEIDDGSRYIFINNCIARGGVCGLQIKGHAKAPAPYHVHVNNFRGINNIIGLEMRHTDWYGVVTDDDGATIPVYNEDGELVGDYGVSPSARNVTLNNIHITAPRNTVEAYSSAYSDPNTVPEIDEPPVKPSGITLKALYGIRISSYENVSLNNIIVTDGVTDYAEDYQPYIDMDGVPIRAYRGARNIQWNNLTVFGFPTGTFGFGTIDAGHPGPNPGDPWVAGTDTWDDPLPDGQQAAVLMSGSFAGGTTFNNLSIIDGPKVGLRATAGVPNVFVDNYNITSDNADVSGSYGIYFTGATTNKRVGQGYVSGFRNLVYNEAGNISVRKAMTAAGVSQEGIGLVWEEGASNATVAGEGVSLDFKVKLVGDTQDYSVAKIAHKKLNNNDLQRTSDLMVQTSTDGAATPTDTFRFGADHSVQSYGAQYVKVLSVVTSAGTTVISDSDFTIVTTGTTTHTLTLPACATGRMLYFKNVSTGTVTINRAGADTIDAGLTTTTIIAGAGRIMVGNGTNWCQVANA